MEIEKLIKEIQKEYGESFIGSTGTDISLLFVFEKDGERKQVYISTDENNDEAMKKIRILMGE